MNLQTSPYLDRVIADETNELRASEAGRNNTLFKVAARLYAFCEAGICPDEYVTDMLTREADALGLGRDEIRTTLKSARKRAMGMDEAARLNIQERCAPGSIRRSPKDDTPSAPELCEAPPAAWRAAGAGLMLWAQQQLHQGQQRARCLEYLQGRGFTAKTIAAAGLGYNPTGRWSERAKWGLPPDEDGNIRVWIPAGIITPWYVDGALWRIQIRREQVKPDQERYKTLPGSSNALYNADVLQPGRPTMLVEGTLDALAVQQTSADLCSVVASGTSGARRVRWLSRLALCSEVLISLDADTAGDYASLYWLDVLPNSRRWRPYFDDAAAMLHSEQDVRGWVQVGLDCTPHSLTIGPIAVEYWREEVRHDAPGVLERLRRICTERGADYDATLAALRTGLASSQATA
jgi:hypothetical protein